MSTIYRGAYATIVALSGTSANAGLPRLTPNSRVYSQLSCCIDGKRLVGLMPTLSQQVWMARWGSRAWTLQEGQLSPRCIYIGDDQVYFECNAMQCSESLNEKSSWVHQTCRDFKLSPDEWSAQKIGAGVLRNDISHHNDRQLHYGARLVLYNYRAMTYPVDALNAFSGILQFLETLYPRLATSRLSMGIALALSITSNATCRLSKLVLGWMAGCCVA